MIRHWFNVAITLVWYMSMYVSVTMIRHINKCDVYTIKKSSELHQ
jgi:hypothetical protein